MSEFKPCKICDAIQGKFSIGGSSGDASYIYVNGVSTTSRLVKDAIEHAVSYHDQLVDTITEQDKVISELKAETSEYNHEWKNAMSLLKQKNEAIGELHKQLEHCHSWLKIHADYHGSPLCINTGNILAKHKQSKGE